MELIKEERQHKLVDNILYFKTNDKVMFLKTELLESYPDLVTGHLKQFNFSSQFNNLDKNHLIEKCGLFLDDEQKNKIYKHNKKHFKKNVLGVTFVLRAGRIVRTIYKKKKDELYIIRDIVGTKNRVGHCFYLGIKDNIRKYIEGKLEIDILDELKNDEQAFLIELEIFIGEVFRQFRYKDNLLKPECHDATPINCLRLNNGKFHFFDFEFEIIDGIAKETMLHKIIHFVCDYFNKKDKYTEYCNYFRTKFNLEDKMNWCEFYDFHYNFFDCPVYKWEPWEYYNNSFYVKFIKKMCKLITLIIPLKNLRQRLRNELTDYFCYPNYKILDEIGLEDFKMK